MPAGVARGDGVSGSGGGRTILEELQGRFKLELSRAQAAEHFLGLTRDALDNWYTRQYDKFQRLSNGILE